MLLEDIKKTFNLSKNEGWYEEFLYMRDQNTWEYYSFYPNEIVK